MFRYDNNIYMDHDHGHENEEKMELFHKLVAESMDFEFGSNSVMNWNIYM